MWYSVQELIDRKSFPCKSVHVWQGSNDSNPLDLRAERWTILLTSSQVAASHKVHTSIVLCWIKKGLEVHGTKAFLAGYRAGKCWRIQSEDLESFVFSLQAALVPAKKQITVAAEARMAAKSCARLKHRLNVRRK